MASVQNYPHHMHPLLHPARTPLTRENFRVRWIRPGSQAVEPARVAEGETFGK